MCFEGVLGTTVCAAWVKDHTKHRMLSGALHTSIIRMDDIIQVSVRFLD